VEGEERWPGASAGDDKRERERERERESSVAADQQSGKGREGKGRAGQEGGVALPCRCLLARED
jgi:hypothetical protein